MKRWDLSLIRDVREIGKDQILPLLEELAKTLSWNSQAHSSFSFPLDSSLSSTLIKESEASLLVKK